MVEVGFLVPTTVDKPDANALPLSKRQKTCDNDGNSAIHLIHTATFCRSNPE
jgi:hypothetical protein